MPEPPKLPNPSILLRPYPNAAWIRRLRTQALAWFRRNQRPLPWRQTRHPYHVWLSEVMLQQTQVATVVDYFHRFIDRFPDIPTLARAREQTVLALWEGLGYYRRARHLHAAARQILRLHQGVFPDQYSDVLALPGIGRYSAGAILSIAFDHPFPILEGNTFRLHARLLGMNVDPRSGEGEQLLWQFAEDILDRKNAGDLNQSLMEIGSEVCKPQNPKCPSCPLQKLCATRELELQSTIPLNSRKTVYKDRFEALVVLQTDNRFLVRQGKAGEWWSGLWDFVRLQTDSDNDAMNQTGLASQIKEIIGLEVEIPLSPTSIVRHGVTNHRIRLACYHLKCSKFAAPVGFEFRNAKQLESLPLNITARKFFSEIGNSTTT